MARHNIYLTSGAGNTGLLSLLMSVSVSALHTKSLTLLHNFRVLFSRQIKLSVGVAVSPEAWSLLLSPLFVGRIWVFVITGLRSSAPRGCLLRDFLAASEEVSHPVVMGPGG